VICMTLLQQRRDAAATHPDDLLRGQPVLAPILHGVSPRTGLFLASNLALQTRDSGLKIADTLHVGLELDGGLAALVDDLPDLILDLCHLLGVLQGKLFQLRLGADVLGLSVIDESGDLDDLLDELFGKLLDLLGATSFVLDNLQALLHLGHARR